MELAWWYWMVLGLGLGLLELVAPGFPIIRLGLGALLVGGAIGNLAKPDDAKTVLIPAGFQGMPRGILGGRT